MKKSLLAILLLGAVTAMAQRDETVLTYYLFKDFTPATVYFKGGGVDSSSKINYNALTNEMVFLSNGAILAMANPENVDSVVIDKRLFVYEDKKFYERIIAAPRPLYEEYFCIIDQPGVETGYGIKNNTTSATYVRMTYGSDAAYKPKPPEGVTVKARRIWWIKTDKGLQKFVNDQQLKKILSDKKDQISAYMKKNSVSFSKADDVAALVRSVDQ